LINGRLVAAC